MRGMDGCESGKKGIWSVRHLNGCIVDCEDVRVAQMEMRE